MGDFCVLCGIRPRESRHHLFPTSSRERRGILPSSYYNQTVWVCIPCHRMIHAELTNFQLFTKYNTLEMLHAYFGHPRPAPPTPP